MEYATLNEDEYFFHVMFKDLKVSYMYNPNYIGLDTKYEYISAQYKFNLTDKDSITPLISTTIVEKPENVDVKNYQELRVTYTRDLGQFKVNTIFSTTNRNHYYTDETYKDTAVAFGVTVPF